ncbi:uncharacterized protein P884DRAFT_265155 [Thermothelomyces heterothallicus CBS 202.75]|uniref:uncharacterized protein n=1 Tax=Thermothelomyces heterothallicus CBS 202.75 TaxID=1149848 RepID=UPI0037429C76
MPTALRTGAEVVFTREMLIQFDIVVTVDSDTMFATPQVPLEWLLDYWRIGPDALVAMADDRVFPSSTTTSWLPSHRCSRRPPSSSRARLRTTGAWCWMERRSSIDRTSAGGLMSVFSSCCNHLDGIAKYLFLV